MPQLLRYRQDTGDIVGLYESGTTAMLELQRQFYADDPNYAHLMLNDEATIAHADQSLYRVKAGNLVREEHEAAGEVVAFGLRSMSAMMPEPALLSREMHALLEVITPWIRAAIHSHEGDVPNVEGFTRAMQAVLMRMAGEGA